MSSLRAAAGHVLSAPVYFAYEGFVRLVNLDRIIAAPQQLSQELIAGVGHACADLDLSSVRLVERSRIPTQHVGVTFGSTIFVNRNLSADSRVDMRLLVHELVHVRQARRFGRFGMARRYGAEWCRCLSYEQHPFEIEARRAEALA